MTFDRYEDVANMTAEVNRQRYWLIAYFDRFGLDFSVLKKLVKLIVQSCALLQENAWIRGNPDIAIYGVLLTNIHIFALDCHG